MIQSWQHKVYVQAVAEASRWRVSDSHSPAPWIDPAEVEAERRRLPESLFARLWRNEWTAPEDRLTTLDDVRACVRPGSTVLDPSPGVRYVLGLDVGVVNDRTALAVGHAEGALGARRVVIDRLQVWAGSRARPVDLSEVEATVAVDSRLYGGAVLHFDPHEAVAMTQRLRAAGVPVVQETFSVASNNRRATLLHRLLREHALSLPDDEDLVDELSMVRLVESSPGVFRLDHDPSRHDDRATAVALVAGALSADSGAAQAYLDSVAPPCAVCGIPVATSRAFCRNGHERVVAS